MLTTENERLDRLSARLNG